MSYYTDEQKNEIYKRWKKNGELWFSKDPSNDPTWEEKQIIIEMKKKEAGVKSNNKRYTVKDLTDALDY